MTMNKNKTGSVLKDDLMPLLEDNRTSLSTAALKQAVLDHLTYSIGRLLEVTPEKSYYKALALSVRDRLQHRWINTVQTYLADGHFEKEIKVACYFSAEFLMGPQLGSSLVNLGIEQEVREAVAGIGKNLDDLIALEEEPGPG